MTRLEKRIRREISSTFISGDRFNKKNEWQCLQIGEILRKYPADAFYILGVVYGCRDNEYLLKCIRLAKQEAGEAMT